MVFECFIVKIICLWIASNTRFEIFFCHQKGAWKKLFNQNYFKKCVTEGSLHDHNMVIGITYKSITSFCLQVNWEGGWGLEKMWLTEKSINILFVLSMMKSADE